MWTWHGTAWGASGDSKGQGSWWNTRGNGNPFWLPSAAGHCYCIRTDISPSVGPPDYTRLPGTQTSITKLEIFFFLISLFANQRQLSVNSVEFVVWLNTSLHIDSYYFFTVPGVIAIHLFLTYYLYYYGFFFFFFILHLLSIAFR